MIPRGTSTTYLPADGFLGAGVHVFDEDSILAVNAAIAARRPLLLRGEPGTGKTQLARAAARVMEWNFVSTVVHAHTEAHSLLYEVDAVSRLGRAQLMGTRPGASASKEATGGDSGSPSPEAGVFGEDQLSESEFVIPGPLWWAFNLTTATTRAVKHPSRPRPPFASEHDRTVVLIDEIDKADSSVPNALLEALGRGGFEVPGHDPVRCHPELSPLVIFTTNEERSLPDAFLRRCLVHHFVLPDDPEKLKEHLVERGRAHFGDLRPDVPADGEGGSSAERLPAIDRSVLEQAAEVIVRDRQLVRQRRMAVPGQAEFMDLIRAVRELATRQLDAGEATDRTEAERALVQSVARYTTVKHPELLQQPDFRARLKGERVSEEGTGEASA